VTGAVAMARARSGGRCLEAKTATNDSQYRQKLRKRPSLFTRDDSMFLTVSLSLYSRAATRAFLLIWSFIIVMCCKAFRKREAAKVVPSC
jgi:hypothetical protein